MKRNFVQVAKFLDDKFPGQLEIDGGLYPAPPIAETLGHVVAILQLIGVAWMVLGGDKLLRMVGFRNLPGFYWTIQDNAVPMAMFLFLIAPQLLAGFANNGAFEIYLEDQTIFSKLNTGRLPTVDDLVPPLVATGLQYSE